MKLSTTTGVLARKFGDAEAIKMIAKAGFDAYDLAMYHIQLTDNPFSDSEYMDYIKNLKKVADECGIVCNQAHSPFPTQLNGSDAYNKKMVDLTRKSMEIASFLGADVVVVHPIKNSSSTVAKDIIYEPFESRKQLYDANVKFFESLIPYCKDFNIKIAVENMWERHPSHHDTLIPAFLGYAEEHKKFLNDINSEWIVGCLDIGHSLICGEKPHEAIHHIGSRLKALHVHDCSGYEDTHTLPYSMSTKWDEILKALSDINYDGDFTLEADNFFKYYPDELIGEALKYMCMVGKYMVKQIQGEK